MNSRSVLQNAIKFSGPSRLPLDLPEKYGSDFARVNMRPSIDSRPSNGRDEWGALWQNIGISHLGEVRDWPLKDWDELDQLKIPDITEARRWHHLPQAREAAPDKFLLGNGVSIYARVHYIRGLENTWMDTITAPEELGRLLDILVDMNLYAIGKYAEAGADGFMFCDDWGLQNRLMIDPQTWRQIWKPRYTRIYQAAHQAGLLTFLHSCGYIVDILDDLIEAGLDVIQMDQQENMGLKLLGERFGGRLTFWCPVDIQKTMRYGTVEEIRAYCRSMVRSLGRPAGGFIAKWYGDPVGAGHSPEALAAMCEEFQLISAEIEEQGASWWSPESYVA